MNKQKSEVIFVHRNLISNRLTYLVHAKSTGELISFGFSDRSVRSLVSAIRWVFRWVQTKNDFTFWLIFGLSPNLGLSETLSERLIQKVKWPSVAIMWLAVVDFWILKHIQSSVPIRSTVSYFVPEFYIINANSLVKPHAFEQLKVDVRNCMSDVVIVVETFSIISIVMNCFHFLDSFYFVGTESSVKVVVFVFMSENV